MNDAEQLEAFRHEVQTAFEAYMALLPTVRKQHIL